MDADLCFHSIVAQLMSLVHAQDMFGGVDNKQMPLLDVEKGVSHIVRFSSGGIRQCLNDSHRICSDSFRNPGADGTDSRDA
jgi:hypothetical protein